MRLFLFIFLLGLSHFVPAQSKTSLSIIQGGFIRSDSTKKKLALVFTADEYGEGLFHIRNTLKAENVKAGFFFTGRFYRNKKFRKSIQQLAKDRHYLGPHSDQHLLYCDWSRRDSLLVTRDSFETDIAQNLEAMKALGLPVHYPHYFIPPYEWWNDTIAAWSNANNLRLTSFTPGIRTNADYTWPEMGAAYKSSEWILQWLKESVTASPQTWNGAVILIHAGTDPRRKDKLYNRLHEIIQGLRQHGFTFRRIDELFNIE